MKSIDKIGLQNVQAVYSGPEDRLSGKLWSAGLKGLTKPNKNSVSQIYFELFS
ncbi:MAG: hypothetical protein NTX52_00460 [Planctomycetota bacterium]|jgi:hypothetical protein|nr:hypothetical protein [Planctomycetota bacterium]